ncbi:Putative Zinc finger, RING/FYVE/PHD-type, ubiquitin specific protease [Septoria linicola]|uniref:Ubiquitin carboxyl-terminal hydrolase n=1 Tax=Septoria linicola TaxID=215465 RepID=A0A9Q9EQS1_9PEZI|nr:putative Zinc finger, RING/FYVE/PHD-type, ubiquitin specific protease [Septoria linicola]USW59415.1 Putative Zinc finger, RING/FYVE/PHD-type, ubiquitin specific protease [Septoria linicola]
MSTTNQTPTATATPEAPSAPKLLKKASTATDAKSITPTQTVFGCAHTKLLLTSARQGAITGYQKAVTSLQKEENISWALYKGANGAAVTGQVTYLCLQCPNVSASREPHRKDHGFAVESANGFLYCYLCKDFVYDVSFEAIRAPPSQKRKLSAVVTDENDKKLVSTNTATTPCAATGLRGLYNMGQTCFMSVILQSLVHNPFIRTYYLSEGHKSSECEREACTSCALDDIFTDFYGTEKHEGYGAVHMLQGCWKNGGSLAGYSQQDAHEFLGFILNSLHEANTEEEDHNKDPMNCECVVHQTFGGMMRSTVTCGTCKTANSTSEAFMDLSLDVKSAGVVVKKKKLALTGATQTVKEQIPVELLECLDRYTSAETLSSDNYTCRKCDGPKEAKKKLSLTRLPPVIPIHFKRFSHSKTSKESQKVDTKVRFPFRLDLSPYLASSKSAAEATETANGTAKEEDDEDTIDVKTPKKDKDKDKAEDTVEPERPIYELSSVVVHKGKIDSGHYISYSRQDDDWFRFDDSMVVQVDEKDVLNAEAYMLFYVVEEF